MADLDDVVREAVIELAIKMPVAESDRVVLPVSDPFDTGPLVALPASVSVAPKPTPGHHDWAAASHHLHVIAPDADQFIRFRRENTSPPARSSSADSALVSDEQRAIFDMAIAHHSAGATRAIALLVLGTAGNGKSYLLGCLSQSFRGSCVVLTPTGVAALNVNGSTCHSFLRLGKTAYYNPLRSPRLLEFQRACASFRYIIIGELSMLGCSALLAVDQRLRQTPGYVVCFVRGFLDYPPWGSRAIAACRGLPVVHGLCWFAFSSRSGVLPFVRAGFCFICISATVCR